VRQISTGSAELELGENELFSDYEQELFTKVVSMEDIDRLHRLWMRLTGREGFNSRLHHPDVVTAVLRHSQRDLDSGLREESLNDLRDELSQGRRVSSALPLLAFLLFLRGFRLGLHR
jgi:hypothetical protein